MASRAVALLVLLSLLGICRCLAVAADDPSPVPVPIASTASYTDAIEAHMGYVTEHALDEYGPDHTPMWLATIDIRTSRLPEQAVAANSESSPSGYPLASSNLYLDQPTVVAAYELSRRTGCKCYSDAASAYTVAFLKASKRASESDLSLRASRHYEVIREALVTQPVESGRRSIHTPAWETIWSEAPEEAERAIRAMAFELINAPHTKTGTLVLASPDLTQRAVALDSLCWLASKKQDPQGELYRLARKIAAETSPSGKPNGEIGVWVESLIRATRYTGAPIFKEMAAQVLSDWLDHHQESSSEPPMPLAEACLSLWEATGDEVYRQAVTRWAEAIRDSRPMNAEHASTGEVDGRRIHFLIRASEVLQQPELRDLAVQVADDAISQLYEPRLGMFRSRTGVDRCDAIDGPGFLLLALLYLDGPDPTAHSSLHF